MQLLERLQAHKGGLLRIKTELYWYGGRGWDKNPGRVCLILDATSHTHAGHAGRTPRRTTTAALLLIDGKPQWIWVAEGDVEVFNEAG